MRKCTFKDKSYAIEFIVNYNKDNEPSLLVINIPGKICEINQHSLCGEVMVEYKGIPENAFVGCFILYIFDINNSVTFLHHFLSYQEIILYPDKIHHDIEHIHLVYF